MQLLEFIFRDLPTFVGSVFMLIIIMLGLAEIVRAARGTSKQ